MRCLLFLLCAFCINIGLPSPPKAQDVFQLQTQKLDPNTFTLTWHIKPGFFLYKKRIHLTPAQTQQFTIGEMHKPKALIKHTQQGHVYSVYRNTLTLPVPVLGKAPGEALINLHYQGCSDDGFCYPPETVGLLIQIAADLELKSISISDPFPQATSPTESKTIEALLTHQSFLLVLISFFGFGLLLSFTPCVLPMIPVLSSIILQHHANLTTKRAFLLSLSYVLGLAITYSIIGASIAYLGSNFQLAFQSPWIIGSFALLFVLLALSMFDVFQLQVPARWQHYIAQIGKQKWGGIYCSTAIMGALSSLILSPCITPPLIGTLAYIAHTGDMLLGSLALFFLGLGEGVPLLLIGTSVAHYLPKAGYWMYAIKAFFGLLLLGVAIQMLSYLLPAIVTMFLWGALFLCAGIFMGAFIPGYSLFEKARQALGLVSLTAGVLILVGGSMGNTNPLQPLSGFQTSKTNASLTTVRTLTELKNILATTQNKPIILDFYADWCADCKVMETTVFQDPKVKTALEQVNFIKVDITNNNQDSKALLHAYDVVAPPTFIFLNQHGVEQSQLRLVGLIPAKTFLEHLRRMR